MSKGLLPNPMPYLTIQNFKSLPAEDTSLALTLDVTNVNHASSKVVTISPSCYEVSRHILLAKSGANKRDLFVKNTILGNYEHYFFVQNALLLSNKILDYRRYNGQVESNDLQNQWKQQAKNDVQKLSIVTTTGSYHVGVTKFRLLWLSSYGPSAMA
jgi:hypothetical protein